MAAALSREKSDDFPKAVLFFQWAPVRSPKALRPKRKRRRALCISEGAPPDSFAYSMAILLEEVSFFGSSFGMSTVSTPDSYLAFTSSGFTSPT